MIDLDSLEKMMAEATEAPWDITVDGPVARVTCALGVVVFDNVDLPPARADRALIVAMRNQLPALLKQLKAARSLLNAQLEYNGRYPPGRIANDRLLAAWNAYDKACK